MNVKKLMSVSLFTFLAASLMFIGGAKADSNDKRDRNDRREERRNEERRREDNDRKDRNDHRSQPRIVGEINTTKTTATVSFKANRFRNETINVIVSVKDRSTDKIVEKAMKAKVDENGNGSVKVTGLKSNTRYDFKVRVMRGNSERSTENSSHRSARTAE